MICSTPSWQAPPEHNSLELDEVHVWRASLDQDSACVGSLYETLTVDERSRAERYYFEKDRKHFIVARGVLREILSRHIGIDPSQLRFTYNEYGKPALVASQEGEGLRFNVSHSGGFALFAFTRRMEIGVDIEEIRMDFASDEIARQFFSPKEVRALATVPDPLRVEAFFNCWTRKEAYIKARGLGLSLPLDGFEVSLLPGQKATLLSTRPNPDEALRWSMCELRPGRGFAAAVAVEGHEWRLKCWQWTK